MGFRHVIFCCYFFFSLAPREGIMKAEMLWAHLSRKCQSSDYSFSLFLGSFLLSHKRYPLTSELKLHIKGKRCLIIANTRQSSIFSLPLSEELILGKHLSNPSKSSKLLQVCNIGLLKCRTNEGCAKAVFSSLLLHDKPFSSHHFSPTWHCTPAKAGLAVTPADPSNEGEMFF